MAQFCVFCSGTLTWKKPVCATMDGEYSHVKCAVENWDSQCNQCHGLFSMEFEEPEEDGKRYCPECASDDAILIPISKSKRAKILRSSAQSLEEQDPDIYDVEHLQ